MCLALIHQSLAAPVDIEFKPNQLIDPRLIPDFHCVTQCLQPTGVESEDGDIELRGLLGNYQALFSCIAQCSKKLRDDMGAPAPKRPKSKVITDECLIKLWQRYDEGLLDIPSFLKAAGLKYFQRAPKR
ncbi:unnamed protein product [Rotaria magnacalcarata]|nr:unnamed protein product [Rotaria magnacalcarata]CAF1578225.1 unnamed protein product [Rotaria magnacalcarata]CAF3747966.1 unnamed protein product [Rotaria magnacalcarata]CAF3750259.1 unnamed protein product [Rotaria magnacalcarata]CAF3787943.1 unnamed protein product [Rotaria magnacalcarata]